MSRSSPSNLKTWKCNNCLVPGDIVTYKIKGSYHGKEDIIRTATVIRHDMPTKLRTRLGYNYFNTIIQGTGHTFAEVYDSSCSIYRAIGFGRVIGTISWPFEWRPVCPRIIVELMDIKHRKYPRLKNPATFEEDREFYKQWEEKLHSSLYEELGIQDIENESQVYIKTSYNYFYSQAVDEKSLPFLKRMAENKQVYRVRPISDEIFKTIIDNGVPIVFDFKDMNVIVFPDIGTGELRRVLINGIDQYRLKPDSIDYQRWHNIDDAYASAFKKSIRYILSLDTPPPKEPPTLLYRHFKSFYNGDTERTIYEQYIPDNKRLFVWQIKLNPEYNFSQVKMIDTAIIYRHSERNKVAEAYRVHADDVTLLREVTTNRAMVPSMYEYEVIAEIDGYLKLSNRVIASSTEEMHYLMNMHASDFLKKKEGSDKKLTPDMIKYNILDIKEVDPLTNDPYDYYWFHVTPDDKIVDLVEKWYKENKDRDKFTVRHPFSARVQAANEAEAWVKLKQKYPSLLDSKNKAKLIDRYKAIYHLAFIRRIIVSIKVTGETIYNSNVPVSYGEDPIYLAMEQIVYHNRVTKEPDIYQVKDFNIDIEYFWAPPHYKVNRATVFPTKKPIQRYFPNENYKGGRRLQRLERQAKYGRSSKNLQVVPIRKYEPNETEEVQVVHYIPQYSYEKTKINFWKYETDIEGKRIKKYIDEERSYETTIRKFIGLKRVVETRTRPVRIRYKGIRNTKRRRKSLALT